MSREDWEKSFENLARIHEASRVFEDFLDFSIDQFTINPNVRLFEANKYSDFEKELFSTLFANWVFCMKAELENKDWYDFLGTVYTEVVQSKFRARNLGQFFTPARLCDLMSQLNHSSERYDSNEDVLTCADHCCGSGRMLLSWHALRPLDLCFGQDIDIVSCKMTVLNFLIHGIKGAVSHMDTINLDWWNGWKINEFIDFGHLSIMQVDSFQESMCFIGHDWEYEPVSQVFDERTIKAAPPGVKKVNVQDGQESLLKWLNSA